VTSGSHAARSEWRSCLQVDATLSRAPSVGQTAVLRFAVATRVPRADVTITAELPAGLRWASAPGGMRLSEQHSLVPENAGRLRTVTLSRAVTQGRPVHLVGVVEAVAPGPAQIRVSATSQFGTGGQAGSDNVFLDVAAAGRTSTFGIHVPKVSGTTAADVPSTASRARAERSVGTAGLRRPFTDDRPVRAANAAASACVAGGWFYVDNTGVSRPSRNFQVQVWDQDTSSGDDLLATGVTGSNGRYSLCFPNDDCLGCGGQDVYLRFISENSLWLVRGNGNSYAYGTGVRNNVGNGSTTNFGLLQPSDATQMRGLHAFDAVNDAWLWKPGFCWDRLDATCRQVLVNWTPSSTDGTYYSTEANDIHLAADDPNAATVVVHELGHAVMDDVYEDNFPAAPNCSPHFIHRASSQGCAWTEGWAEWFPASVYRDPFFRWPTGESLDLENATWGTPGWDNTHSVEGRVAGALIDISDATNEGTDRVTEDPRGPLWTTFLGHRDATLAEFWADRRADGFDVSNNALGALFQNTINYGFTG
jgi:hypothetical protein